VAAQMGDVEVMHLLRYGFGLTEQDAAAHDHEALCMAGSVEVLVELRTAWGWGRVEARAQKCAVLARAVRLGDVSMVRELRLGYGLCLGDLHWPSDRSVWSTSADMAAEIECWVPDTNLLGH